MKEEINKLKEAFCNAENEVEREEIDRQMQELINQNPDNFAQAMIESAKETAERATQLSIRQKMQDIIPAISLVYIAKTYFNKTDAWLYQRINGNIVNGKPASFSTQELAQLKFAFDDLSNKLGLLSISL